ncbi:PREDICTED: uncharacterized protein LOC109586683 [Amphimedon queenslandica]|uniref:SAM domain-containing protein n=1 Tax=Amphimedon queenslandica TaxID=400682 RepID=A0AAN0JNU2_AMPQE|nr:PREDICTED: uncharacterized protein LOC109586683 [Amphimedon queenslandica]|eukprot:XP_019858453.1 PREDICTED: uncharacterized protein LOC109586683 [Amphimedon queenslandica]
MDQEALEKLSPSALSEFLNTDVGIPLSICQAFEEELVDGPALLDLTEEDVKGICKKIGPTKKICRFINQVLGDKSEVISTDVSSVRPSSSQLNPSMFSPPIAHSPSLSDLPSSPVSHKLKLKSFSSSLSHNDPSSPISFISSPSPLTCTDSDECSSSISSLHVSSKFFIPDTWRPSIMECINAPSETEARRLLTPKIRSEIVRDLVTQMYTVWPNPKSAESTVVARKLVSKYVFMKDKGQAVSGYGSWERKIIDRIHNVSVSVKRKETNESSDAPVSKRGRPKSTTLASRYPPLQHDFSDDTSFNRNIDKIKSEMCMSNPRKQVLLKLMEDTYARRREMVLGKQGVVSVSHVLELFPCLKMYSIVSF